MGIFDDIPSSGGRKGTFDDIPDNKPDGGLLAAAKQGIGQSIKGIGQAASDFIPGVSPQNPISQYGQSVVDANQTAVNSLGGIVDSPWTAVKEAVGNAAGSMGTMLGARVLGTGITAAAPFTGPAAPVVAGAGQIIANVGPIAAAALPSYSGIRETQIAADQGNEADAKSKAIAALGAATVGAIETKFGPQEWALQAMKKGGFGALKDKLGAETLRGAVGKGLVKGAAIEGAEELVQNPIEQLSGYQNPTTPEALQETAFGGAMGAIGGGVVGGGVSGIAHFAEKPKGPLQKAAEASSATVPTDAATIPPGGQTSATIPQEAAQPAGIPAGTVPADPETQPPAAGIASADQNTPAAPGISPVPVSTAEPTLPSNQAESAGVPVVDQQSQEGAAKSGNETEIPQPAEPGQQAKPASVSDSARLDWEKDAEALATEATRLREMAARAVGQTRIRLTDLAGRMEAAREAIVGQAGATNKDSLTVEGKAPAVTSQSPAAPVQSPAKKSIDLSTRTDAQLTILERNRIPKVRKLAAEEMARRTADGANETPADKAPLTESELADFIQSESADLDQRRGTLRELQAISRKKQADDADKTEIAALIESETKDLRERLARLRSAQAAAKGKTPFVIPALTTPEQPTTHGAPMEQKAAELPIGKYAKAELVWNADKLPAVEKSSSAGLDQEKDRSDKSASAEWVGATVLFTSPSGRAKRGSVIRVANGKAVVVSPVGQNYVAIADLKRSKSESTPLKGVPASDNSAGKVKALEYARQELAHGTPHWYVANALVDDVFGNNSKLSIEAFSYVMEADSHRLWRLIDAVARQLGDGAASNGDVRRETDKFVARQTTSDIRPVESKPAVKPEQSGAEIPTDTGGGKAEQPATAKLFQGASQALLARIEKGEKDGKPIVVVRGAFSPDAEYTLYEKGYRIHLSKNWEVIQGEVSGSDPVRMAMRYRAEEDIVYASPAAKQQMAEEAQAIADQKAKDKAGAAAREANAKAATEARERLSMAIASSGAKFTKGSFTAKSEDGDNLQDIQGLTHGGLIVHKSPGHYIRGPQQYTISHIGLGISVLSGFKSQDAAKQAAVRLVMLADMGQLKTKDDINKDAFRPVVMVGSAIKKAGGDPLAGAEIDFPSEAVADKSESAKPDVKNEAKTKPASSEPLSNAEGLPASVTTGPTSQPPGDFSSRTLWSVRDESGTQGAWIGDLMKGAESYPVRATYKRTNRADWWIDIYDGSKLNQSIPFAWMQPSTTVQEAIDALVRYVQEDKSAEWSFANVGKKHNALLAKKDAIAKRKSSAEAAAIDKRIAEIGGTVGAPWAGTDKELLANLEEFEERKYKTASDETMIRLLRSRIASNPSRFAPGTGVGWRVSANQINRGFRVVSVDEVAKKAVIRQVSDSGLTSSGGNNDRIEDTEVYVADLLRDRKYDAATQPIAAPRVEGSALPIVEHVTAKGKTLRGTVRTDLTLEQARALDKFTFKKDGGYFIRENPTAGTAADPGKQPAPADSNKPDRSKQQAAKLRALGEKLVEAAQAEMGRDRLTNTARRARQASNSEASAAQDKLIGETMIRIADAIEDGRADALAGITARTQVEQLDSIMKAAIYRADHKAGGYDLTQKNKGRRLLDSDLQFIERPGESRWISGAKESLIRAIDGKRGAPRLRSEIQFSEKYNPEIHAKLKEILSDAEIKSAVGWGSVEEISDASRLARAGITNIAQLRRAISEYAQIRAAKTEVNKAKALERALIGQNVGVDFFPTPASVAADMVRRAGVEPGMRVLEPSAGNGNIAEAIKSAGVSPDVIEISSSLREILDAKGFNLVGQDFMETSGQQYDRIVMNPPFSNRMDAEHVQHAYSLLKPGGKIVAIMGEGVFFGEDAKAVKFREWLDSVGGTSEKMPQGTFTDRTLMATTSVNSRMVEISRPDDIRYNLNAAPSATPADRAVYDMAQEGKSAAEILSFIGKASRRPFNRYLANALKNLGASSTITLDSQGGWRFGNTSRAQKYAAAYNSRTDTVALSTAREAERHILHELVHAATMKAIKAGWPAAVRMRALFKHVQKSGKVNGQYGMSNLDEFVAEAFTNPKFQEALKGVPAPAGSTLKSAWQWFVNIVARVLGFKTSVAKTALDRAMTIGAQLMRENAAVMAASEDTRYAIAWHGTPHVWGPEPGFPHGRPRLDKIGTGEGAQAYGWGWYSADSRSVADSYHKQLSAAASLGLRRWRYLTDGMSQKEAMVVDQMNAAARAYVPKGEPPLSFRNYLDFYNAKARVRELDLAFYAKNKDRIDANTAKLEAFKQANPEGYKDLMGDEPPDWAARPYAAAYAQAEKVINEYVSGALYQLDIPDDVMPKLLDWDKPMSRQPKDVQASLRRLYDKLGWRWNDSQTGNVIYETLTGDMLGARNHGLYGDEGSKAGEAYDSVGRKTNHLQAASEYLASLGIPGLRYLDGTSRNKGEGSYNYVIWDQKVLDRIALLERNGEKLDAIRAAEETRYSLDGSQPFDGREVATTPLKPGTTTLMVDGTERPALNSNGKPIHWSEEGVRNFWRWFGDSKVVDAQGRPLVVYHGSPDIRFIKEEAIFKSQKDRTGFGRSDAAHWFSSDPRTAKSYSDPRRAFDYQNSEEGVIESYLRIENPLVVHADGQEWKTAQKRGKTSDVIEEARASSKDGVIINNVRDDYNNSRSTRPTRTFTVFESTQIKSSTGNTGAFSPTDPDIRFSAGADWYNGPSGAPVRNAWQRAKAKAAEILSPKNLDKIIYELQDKHIDLRRLRDHIQAIGGTITDMNDAYLGEELYHKRLAHRTDEFLKAELRPLLAEMKARGVSIQDLETFLHARHAPEANAEMAKRNPNQAEIDAGQKKSATLVRNLEQRLQNAKARGSATVAIEQALNDARGKLLQWNGAQAFRGTEEERRSLSGLSDADAAAIMNGLTPERRAAMDTLAARVDAINEGTLQHLQHYGLMSRESLDTWRKTYRYYVPLHRDEAHPDSANHPIGQGFSVKGDAAKRRTGSNQQVTNILGHIAMQREAALTRGEKNHVMRKLYLMARQNPLPDVWKVGEVPMIDTIDKETGFVRTVPDPLYKTRPNVIMLRVAGKDVAIVMNEHNPQALRMAQALKNLDVDDLHYLIPVVGKMTRYFASINTQYNPIFGVINLMRDTQEAALNLSTTELSGKQKEVMTDTLSILKEVLKNKGRMPKTGAWATLFEEFNRVGGTTGYRDLFLDAESRSKSLLDELKALDRGKVSQAAHAVADWLSDYNEAMENATRLAAYKAAIDNGMSKERAASLAKNLTVNFNRKGRQTRELGALYAFFNAAVQGTTRMAQTLAGPAGRKIMAGGVMLGVMNALLGIAAMGGGDGEDDEWEKIPEFIKERSVIIPTGKDSYLSIPMPLGFQFLPNIGRLAVEMAVYKDKTAGKQMVALFQVLADAFNPMGGSSPPMQIAAPTVLDPFVALAQNKDWTGKPIFIENRNSLDPKPGLQRSKDSATPWAKGVAEAINAITGGTKYTPGGWSPTPDQIDYVIGQLTGGIGREAGKVAATATAPFTGEELPPYKIPLVGRLYGSTAGHSGQSDKFYENITKANEVENEIKGRVRDGISVADYLADHPGAISLAARGNVAERQVAALRKARHAVTMKGGADEVSKVRAINERIANVMRNFNRDADLIGKRYGQ